MTARSKCLRLLCWRTAHRPLILYRSRWQKSGPSSNDARIEHVTIEQKAPTSVEPAVPVRERRPYELDETCLRVTRDHKTNSYNFVYLRDACSCSRCVDPSTKQKTFQTSDIRNGIRARKLKVLENGDVECKWHRDVPGFGHDHTTIFPRSFFLDNWTRRDRVLARYDDQLQVLWNKEKMEEQVKWISYNSYMKSEKSLHEALTQLSRYGLLFLSDVPSSEESVINIGTRIGPLRDSFYGRTWDVKSVPNAKNVAYTHQNLGLHMDLLYMREPPGLQLLHCLRASCSGGNSLFSDSYRTATRFREADAFHFKALLNFPVTYHYRNAGQHYHYTRPTVELEKYGYDKKAPDIAAVNWAPPFQAPFEIDIGCSYRGKVLGAYLEAARRFAGLVEADTALFELRLEEGQCVIFNNRRVLHARRAFDIGTGERWLKGAYLDSDVFFSKLRVSTESFRRAKETDLSLKT